MRSRSYLPCVWRMLEQHCSNQWCVMAGALKLVFATDTLAAGINMPARTTVISSLSRRRNVGHALLFHNELLQMAGRAGRRGFDTAGECPPHSLMYSFTSLPPVCSRVLVFFEMLRLFQWNALFHFEAAIHGLTKGHASPRCARFSMQFLQLDQRGNTPHHTPSHRFSSGVGVHRAEGVE